MVLNLHGESGLAKAAILLSFIMPLYNVLAVIALTLPQQHGQSVGRKKMVILFSLFAAPTAVVSYIMARSMDGDTQLAADIVLLSTLGSVATLSAGVFMMKTFGMI